MKMFRRIKRILAITLFTSVISAGSMTAGEIKQQVEKISDEAVISNFQMPDTDTIIASFTSLLNTAKDMVNNAVETMTVFKEQAENATEDLDLPAKADVPTEGVINNALDAVSVLKEQAEGLKEKTAGITDALNTAQVSGLEEVSLVRVVDGDTLTIVAEDGLEYKVRLIGIDTPESVHADKTKNNEYGKMASEHTKEILADVDTLYLEYDKQVTDKYNRTLAYVWFSPETEDINNMLNARIIADGFAVDKVYKPNNKYADEFAKICNEASENGKGLWEDDGFHELTGR